jgi:hypothetical protein
MKNLLKTGYFLFLLLFVSSCAQLNKLDLAQRSFSEGATIENNAQMLQQLTAVSPEAYYKIAYASVQESLKKSGKLKEDGLLGNAYTLKSLCEWKLGKYDLASDNAKIALTYLVDKNNPNALLTRDGAVMKSMDALINLEQLNALVFDSLNKKEVIDSVIFKQFFNTQLWGNRVEKKGELRQSFEAINSVLTQGPRRHEVRNYLVMSMLTGMKNWGDALHYLNNNLKKLEGAEKEVMKAYYNKENDIFEKEKKVLLRQFSKLLVEGKESQVYKYWAYMLGA